MRAVIVALGLCLAGVQAAEATSGFGCYRVNVGPDDPLAIRMEPDASSPVVIRVDWSDQPIIALDGVPRGREPSLFDVHRAELDNCVPATLPLGARWCPVSLFAGGQEDHGWIKRRYVDHSECP